MIARRHIPLARADEDSRTLLDGTRKIPARIFDWIRRRDESDSLAAANRSIKIRGLRRRRDATVRAFHDLRETGQLRRIAQLLRDLMQSRFFQGNRNDASFVLQRGQSALRVPEITAEQKQHRCSLDGSGLYFAMKTSASTGGVG